MPTDRRTRRPAPTRHAVLLAMLALACAAAASAQQKFIDRNFNVRIGLYRNITALAMLPEGVYNIEDSNGPTKLTLLPGTMYHVQITRGQAGGRSYRIVLGEFDQHQSADALALSGDTIRTRKEPVKVISIPAEGNKPARLLVTLGLYDTLQEARTVVQSLKNPAIQFIYEERSQAERGEIRIMDARGRLVARDARQLNLRPARPADDSMHLRNETNSPEPYIADAKHYRGQIRLQINEEGTLTAVNELLVEYYLYSVVASEIGSDAPAEALKAQAVAGRSEAVAKIQRGIVSSAIYDFVDTAMAQQYVGKGAEKERVRQAVDQTRGEILVWPGREGGNVAVDAVYSNSCGGVICSSLDMWGGRNEEYAPRRYDTLATNATPNLSSSSAAFSYISQAQSVFCNPNQIGFPRYAVKYDRWTRRVTGAEVTRCINEMYDIGRVNNIVINTRTPSGRVSKMTFYGESNTAVVRGEQDIRSALGGLYSTFFTMGVSRGGGGYVSSVTVNGAGYGHGVGMCQMGAFMMAKKGYTYRQILAHYYALVKMRKLYQ